MKSLSLRWRTSGCKVIRLMSMPFASFGSGESGRGQEKLGLLLLVALKPPDEKGECPGESRLEVGRHLEGDVPDGLAWEMIRRMRDDLKACRIDQGLTTGVKTLLATVAQSRGVSIEGIDSNQAYRPQQRRASREPRHIALTDYFRCLHHIRDYRRAKRQRRRRTRRPRASKART